MGRWLINIYLLGVKELRSLSADPILLLLIAYMFSFAIYAVATGAKTEVSNAAVAYVDLDQSDLTGRIVDAILPPEFETPQRIALSDVQQVMDNDAFVFVLSFPPRFEADVLSGAHPSLPAFLAIILPMLGYSSCTVLMSRLPHRMSSMLITLAPFFDAGLSAKPGLFCVNRTTVGAVPAAG